MLSRRAPLLLASLASLTLATASCGDTPSTSVVLDDDYPAAAAMPLVVYAASWQAVMFSTPVPPGGTSGPQSTLTASDNTAYAVLAPGWDPASSTPPSSLVVLQSRDQLSVHLNTTLTIHVDDAHFAGNCAAGSRLAQAQADFVTQLVFPGLFGGTHYDAATCTSTPVGDAGGE